MAMLIDTDIKKAIQERKVNPKEGIGIEPFDETTCLTPVGYDLRVGTEAFSWKKKSVIDILQNKGRLCIEPHDTVVIKTLESIELSKSIGATIHSMVSRVVPEGLSHISTTIDPGWTGQLLVSVHNYGESSINLKFQQPFCTVCFYEVKSPAEKDVRIPVNRDELWERLLETADREKQRQGEAQRNRIVWRGVVVLCLLVLAVPLALKKPDVVEALAAFIGVVLGIWNLLNPK